MENEPPSFLLAKKSVNRGADGLPEREHDGQVRSGFQRKDHSDRVQAFLRKFPGLVEDSAWARWARQ